MIDGDTIEVQGRRIRFSGIDAPESRQECTSASQLYACGERATAALKNLIDGRAVECRQSGVDPYGRALADCSVSGQDIEAWMVAQGWAMAYRRYSTAYVAEEDQARAARRGIWSGEFEAPWDWRHRR